MQGGSSVTLSDRHAGSLAERPGAGEAEVALGDDVAEDRAGAAEEVVTRAARSSCTSG